MDTVVACIHTIFIYSFMCTHTIYIHKTDCCIYCYLKQLRIIQVTECGRGLSSLAYLLVMMVCIRSR